mmetsp:Transcript_6011/g.17109  ORF Transcript_6011/g.17109 Transcript_6011/m.17109 type:complete len:84 (+) Transcript_6011:4387-4638(+)
MNSQLDKSNIVKEFHAVLLRAFLPLRADLYPSSSLSSLSSGYETDVDPYVYRLWEQSRWQNSIQQCVSFLLLLHRSIPFDPKF